MSTVVSLPLPPTVTHRSSGIGVIAARALAASAGRADPIAAFAETPYLSAQGEIIWIGDRTHPRDGGMHPRIVLVDEPVPRGLAVHFSFDPATTWRPRSRRLDDAARHRLLANAAALVARIGAIAMPRGFGALIVGAPPPFPLDLASEKVRRLAAAATDDEIVAAGAPLIGLGTGLTPSGDDLVGALLFARRLIAPGTTDGIARELSRIAGTQTHAISAALFADLAAGCAYERLHRVADALIDDDTALDKAVVKLGGIGHSSGWDMLTGFLIGLLGPRAIAHGKDGT